MSEAGMQNCRLTLMLGAVMVFAAIVVQATPLAERVPQKKNEKLAKSKAVHFIEKRPEASSKAHVEMEETELPLLVPEKLPVGESQPLELKGVRG